MGNELGDPAVGRDAGAAAGVFDFDSPAHRVAFDLLGTERIGWLASVRPDGDPAAVPVWFDWAGGVLTILSKPTAHKVRNLAANPRALLHLNAIDDVAPVVIVRGDAALESDGASAWAAAHGAAFADKYADELANLYRMSLAQMAGVFSTVIRIRPTSLTTWGAEPD